MQQEPNKERNEAIAQIIRKLRKGELHYEDIDLVRGLLLTHRDDPLYDKELKQVFDQVLRFDPNPGPGTYKALEEIRERLGMKAPLKTGLSFYRRIAIRVATVAAVITVFFATALLLRDRSADNSALKPMGFLAVTAGQGPTEVRLPDGTLVRLTENSELSYAADFGKLREVRLEGEAFFSVVKNSDHPFTVTTDELTVTVLGTEFNMIARAGDATTVVSLTSGSVEIKDSKGTVVLAPMERLTYDKTTGEGRVTEFDPDQIERWKTRTRELRSVPLPQALVQIAEFYGKQVVMERLPADSVEVNIVLREDTRAEEILELILFMAGNFRYEVSGNTIYIR